MLGKTVGHLAPFEALRGVAAWSIVTYHVWLFTSAGTTAIWNLGPATMLVPPLQSGVTLFFVLSGFLLYRPWVVDRGPALRPYLRNRALRILPAYWIVIMASTAVGAANLRVSSGGAAVIGKLNSEQLAQTLTLVQGYRPQTIFNGIPPAWSLGVEAGFYLLLPFVALTARRSLWLPPAVFFAAGLAGKVALTAAGVTSVRFASTWESTLSHSLLANADLFGFGMCAAVVYTRYQTGWASNAVTGRILAYLGIPWTVMGYYFLPAYVYESGVALFVAGMLLRVLQGRQRFLETRVARASGRISYSVFLWNFPVLAFMSVHGVLVSGHGVTAFLANMLLVVATVATLSGLTYRLVEAPALRLKRRTVSTRPARLEPATSGS